MIDDQVKLGQPIFGPMFVTNVLLPGMDDPANLGQLLVGPVFCDKLWPVNVGQAKLGQPILSSFLVQPVTVSFGQLWPFCWPGLFDTLLSAIDVQTKSGRFVGRL